MWGFYLFSLCYKLPQMWWLEVPLIYALTVARYRSPGAVWLHSVLCSRLPDSGQDVGWAELLPGGSGEEATSKLIPLVGRIQLLAAVGLRSVCLWRVLPGPSYACQQEHGEVFSGVSALTSSFASSLCL